MTLTQFTVLPMNSQVRGNLRKRPQAKDGNEIQI